MRKPAIRAKAFAPATVANVAVGFDLLGFSFPVVGDTVEVRRVAEPGVRVERVSREDIPKDPSRNTATAGLFHLINERGLKHGFAVSIEKGIASGSGMGGSAASAVAGIVAASELLEIALTKKEMLRYALIGEGVASGSFHADNLAPCLFGGLTLATVGPGALPEVDVLELPLPSVFCSLVHPEVVVNTKEARGILKPEIPLKAFVAQSAHLARFIAGCFRGDDKLLRSSLKDVVIEPQRSSLIPGFAEIQRTALATGAWGCSISGSGPSVFAWSGSKREADAVLAVMLEPLKKAGIECQGWVSQLSNQGARVLEREEG